MTKSEEAAQLFEAMSTPEPETNAFAAVDPDDGPLPNSSREALSWLRSNGVSECTLLDIGTFKFFPVKDKPPQLTLEEVKQQLGFEDRKPDLEVGGYDKEVLYAASPNPYAPRE